MRPLAIFLITLLLLQNLQVFMCRQSSAKKRQADALNESSLSSSSSSQSQAKLSADSSTSSASASSSVFPFAKRTIIGQPEELLHSNDQMDSNYDEYPMIVPKRAALLLDRLMVALHHALEKEQSGRRRIIDLYMNKNGENERSRESKDILIETPNDDDFEQGTNYNMYSDDDPSVIMDYDFKDLNSINRATGETLMAKSFQRRALGMDMGGGGDFAENDVSMLRAAAATSDELGVGSYVGGRNNVGTGGRVYWRCYFNAVSCF